MNRSISTIGVIRALTPAGAALFEQQLGWLNPLPSHIDAVLERIHYAIERSAYVADRSGKQTNDPAELAALRREIEVAIQKLLAASGN